MESILSKAERTKKFIIESTASIFNMKGYAGTSMSDLTEATGLTKGSIYGNFENKEEVALAAFDYNLSKIKSVVNLKVGKSVSYHDKLMVYAQVYHSFKSDLFPPGGCPVLNTSVEADDTHTLLKEKAAKAIAEWKKNIVDLIEAGINACEFKTGQDTDQTALSMIALIEGGIMIAKVTDNAVNLNKILKTVEQLILDLRA